MLQKLISFIFVFLSSKNSNFYVFFRIIFGWTCYGTTVGLDSLGPLYTMDHKVGPWKMALFPWSGSLKKSIDKTFGPFTRCKPNVDQEEWILHPKVNVFSIFDICPKNDVLDFVKIKFVHLIVFSSLHSLFSQTKTKKLKKSQKIIKTSFVCHRSLAF